MKGWKKIASVCVILFMLFSSLNLNWIKAEEVSEQQSLTEKTYEGDGFKVTYVVENQWDEGFNAQLQVTNTGTEVIDSWGLLFYSENNIQGIWNAKVQNVTNNYYTLQSTNSNQDIKPNETVNLGFSCNEKFTAFPDEYILLGKRQVVMTENVEITYSLQSAWNVGFNGLIEIKNTTDSEIRDWELCFQFDNEINTLWNGVIEKHENNEYLVKNAGYNQNIAPDEIISFGFLVQNGDRDAIFKELELTEVLNEQKSEPIELDAVRIEAAYNDLQIGYQENDTYSSVTNNLILQEESNGIQVLWESSNETIISTTGVVTRQENTEWVNLTATLSCGEYVVKKEFEVCVIKNKYVDYNTDYIEDADSFEFLYGYNEGDLDNLQVYVNDEGYLSFISGCFTDIAVESPEEAVLSLYSLRTLMGIKEPKEELKWLRTSRDEFGTVYSFAQMVDGVPVYGRTISVGTDINGITTSLQNSYVGDLDISVKPSVSSEDVVADIQEKGYITGDKPQLYIYEKEQSYYLTWVVTAYNSDGVGYRLFINAISGEELSAEVLTQREEGSTTSTGSDEYGNVQTIDVTYCISSGKVNYKLIDRKRNIAIYDMNKSSLRSALPGTLCSRKDHAWSNVEITTMSNVKKAYDFYYNLAGRRGFDDNNTTIDVSIWDGTMIGNSCHSVGNLRFGYGGSYIYSGGAALDTVGHEYTHGVVAKVASLPYSNETGAINEGYADIFGYFIEGDSDPEWLHREDNTKDSSNNPDNRGIRNMSNPSEHSQPAKVGDKFYQDYAKDTSDNGGVHTNNTIISHACYLMWHNGITDKDRLAKLWYRALLIGYDSTSTFITVRTNILTAAKNMRMTSSDIEIINNAFDEVGIGNASVLSITGTNTLSGKVVVADEDTVLSNNTPLPNADVTLIRSGASVGINILTGFKKATTEEDGTYYFINLVPGTYILTVSCSLYYNAKMTVDITTTNMDNFASTVELIPKTYTGLGIAKGMVKDAVTGQGVEGMSINIRSGINVKTGKIVSSTTTDERGEYSSILDTGHYTLEIIDNRVLGEGEKKYLTAYRNIKVLGGKVISNQDAVMSTTLLDGQLRIVLQWGAVPSDLDSHLLIPQSTGGTAHVYYRNKVYKENDTVVAFLDLDDTSSYGPETTTIYNVNKGVYTFYVHNYSGRPAMSTSNASVSVYNGASNEPAYTFNVPLESGLYWTVFTYDSNKRKITPVNVVGNRVVS